MKTTNPLLFAAAAFLCAASLNAQGQSFTAQLGDPGIDPFLTFTGTRGGQELDFPAGVMNFTIPSNGSTFNAFCVEPLEDISYGDILVYEIQNPSYLTPAKTETIALLIGKYLSTSYLDPNIAAQNASAVQWAIWEVTNETSAVASLFAGIVAISDPDGGDVASLANLYLADVSAYVPGVSNFSPASVTYLTNPSKQDVVTWNLVPEPTSVGLALISGMFLLRRRRA